MKRKNTLVFILVSILLVLGVNISGNYRNYAEGADWKQSVFFVLTLTLMGWLIGIPVGKLLRKLFADTKRPLGTLLFAMLILAVQGALMMIVALNAMVIVFHFHAPNTAEYVAATSYSVLFTLIIGLMATGQQFLQSLLKSKEDNERMKQEMIRSQYEALKSQVNPHFLFNSLNTLTVMISTQPELAVKFVEQMSKVFRYSLQNSAENIIDVGTELKVVQSFLFLNEQRFEGKLCIDIAVTDRVMQRQIITQSLLMLAENAIKHNEISTDKPLTVSISNDDDYLIMENTLQRRAQIEASTNIGLANIKQRYALVSEKPVVVEETNNMFTVKLPLI